MTPRGWGGTGLAVVLSVMSASTMLARGSACTQFSSNGRLAADKGFTAVLPGGLEFRVPGLYLGAG
jgi:hypothetical protein